MNHSQIQSLHSCRINHLYCSIDCCLIDVDGVIKQVGRSSMVQNRSVHNGLFDLIVLLSDSDSYACLLTWLLLHWLLLHWLIDYLIDWLIGLSSDWLLDWLLDWLIQWLIDWLIDRLLTYLIVIALIVITLIDCLLAWLIDWLACHLTDCLSDGLMDWLIDCLTDWLNDGLMDWLIDRLLVYLIGCLIGCYDRLNRLLTRHQWSVQSILSLAWFFIDWLIGWLVDWQLDMLTAWHVDWWLDWQIDSHNDWLSEWVSGWDVCGWSLTRLWYNITSKSSLTVFLHRHSFLVLSPLNLEANNKFVITIDWIMIVCITSCFEIRRVS